MNTHTKNKVIYTDENRQNKRECSNGDEEESSKTKGKDNIRTLVLKNEGITDSHLDV